MASRSSLPREQDSTMCVNSGPVAVCVAFSRIGRGAAYFPTGRRIGNPLEWGERNLLRRGPSLPSVAFAAGWRYDPNVLTEG